MRIPDRCSLLAMALVLAAAVGCGGNGGPSDAGDVPGTDATDTIQTPDVPDDPGAPDVPADPGAEDVPSDEGTPEDAGDAGEDPGVDPGEPFECPTYDAWPAVDDGKTKFGLTMFHWNIQYVPGGLIGEWEGETISMCDDMFGGHDMCLGWTDEVLLDWIVRVSFLPILDLYLKHPDWRATFEMPGLMVEVIAQRHPDVMAKLQCAANSGQIEMVSIHWSDQLFLAFPSRDLEWSIAHNRKVFEEAALPLSGVVFNQEGQSGVGKHRIMAENGYAIDVMHRNLYRYHQQADVDDGVWPVYESTGPGAPGPVKVVVGGDVDPAAGIEVDWTFFDDGEVLATPGNPYLAPVQPEPDWKEVGNFERKLQARADAGYIHTTITDYVARLEQLGIAPEPLLPFGDSTWQPPSTEGISRWMGRMGTLAYSLHEHDNLIRTVNYRVSTCLAAAALLADLVEDDGHDVAAERARIDAGYLDLIRAQVSDATGINPWMGEWVYGYVNNEGGQAACDDAADALLAKWGRDHVLLDLDARVAKADGTFEPQFQLAPTDAAEVPVALDVVAAGRTVETRWADDGRVYRLEVDIGASDDPTGEDRGKRTVTLAMPLAGGTVRYTPGLIEDAVVEIPLADLRLLANHLYLPLANGLIGLGPDLWLIKSCRDVHLAARVSTGDADRIEFIDETVPPAGDATRIFYVLKGTAEEALALARLLNTHPNVILARPDAADRRAP